MDNKEPNFQMSFAFIDRQIDGNICLLYTSDAADEDCV